MPSPKRRRLKKLAAIEAQAEAPPAEEEETVAEAVVEKVKGASKSLGSKLKKLIKKKED